MEFVSFEEAKQRLGKTDEELQEMIKSGKVRAFRDGGTWKFRKEDLDALVGKPAAAEKASETEGGKEDAGDTLMSIDADILFAEEEEVPADSAAETWIAADTEGVFPGGAPPGEERPRGVEEAMVAPEAEPAPLALTPETDESSLQEVLSEEEVAEGAGGDVFAEEPVIAVDTGSGVAAVVPSATQSGLGASRTRVVTLVEPPAHHPHFTVMLALAAVALAFTVVVIFALLTGARSSVVASVGGSSMGLAILVAGIGIVGIIFLIGHVMEKQRKARESVGGP